MHTPRFCCRLLFFDALSTVRSRSPSWSLPDSSHAAFSSSLTTTVFSQCSTRWLDISPTQGDIEGPQTFIFYIASLQEDLPTLSPLSAFVAHMHEKVRQQR